MSNGTKETTGGSCCSEADKMVVQFDDLATIEDASQQDIDLEQGSVSLPSEEEDKFEDEETDTEDDDDDGATIGVSTINESMQDGSNNASRRKTEEDELMTSIMRPGSKTALVREALVCLYVLQTVSITVLVYFLADAANKNQQEGEQEEEGEGAANEMEYDVVGIPPLGWTFLVASIFSIVGGVAFAYHTMLVGKLRKIHHSAAKSKAVLWSLFPDQFRKRLLEEEDHKGDRVIGTHVTASLEGSFDASNSSHTNLSTNESNKRKAAAPSLAKTQLRSFLHMNGSARECGMVGDSITSKPIADLFPHCTILFADITGFTAWSSEREPVQVFALLECVYRTFDRTAKRLKVFKVETIGGRYMCVTGLPDPQPDHAVRMVKFARQIRKQMNQVVKRLESTLGPDTGDLRLRQGIHSGPVTAGVLRGEKSRFQLFGDTVNSASKLETTSERNRIQLSQVTADLLIEDGKIDWVTQRAEVVHAKGKGDLTTFWAVTNERVGRRGSGSMLSVPSKGSGSSTSSGDGKNTIGWGGTETPNENLITGLPPMSRSAKNKRLIDWNVEMLTQQLKRIVAQRNPSATQQAIEDPNAVLKKKGETPYEEVVEALVLPQFGNNNTFVDSSVVELNENVVPQLLALISRIGEMYRDNPFHNFEHASHVTMSVHKLLNRVVTPDEVDYDRDDLDGIGADIHNYTYGITSDALCQFAIVFSALIHDVDHVGVSNGRLAEENQELNEKYKGKSIAEQNSVDLAWNLLMQPEYKDLQQCIFANEEELHRFRSTIVNCILATDIFEKDAKAFRNQRWDKAFHGCSNENEANSLKATIVIEHIIQASDVSHCMQHWNVYQKWNERLFREMYLAFDEGRSAMNPSEGWYKGELWFYDNYVIPLAKKLAECKVFGVSSDEYLNYAIQNRREWAAKGEQVVQEMVDRYQKRKEMEIGGLTKDEINNFTPEDLDYIMKKLIEKGRSNGTRRVDAQKGQKDAAQAWMDALEVYERCPAAMEMRDKSIVFPVYSGIHVWLKGGKIQNDKDGHFEQNLARKFVNESKAYRRKDVVPYIRAMGMLCEVTAGTGNYETAFKLLEDLKTIYNTAKHSRAIEKFCGVDRGACIIAHSAMWYDELGEMEKALEVCDYVMDQIVPLVDPTNTLGMFELLTPIMKVLNQYGYAKRCHDIFSEHVHEAFLKNHGPDAFTPTKSLHQPIVWLLAMKVDPNGFADFEKVVEWLADGDNGVPNDFLDNLVTKSSWSPSDMAAELCLLVAQRLEREGTGETEVCKTIAEKGLKLARNADNKIKNKDGQVVCQFPNAIHAPLLEELETLTMSLGVYSKAPERTEPVPGVAVALPPSYLVAPTDAAEFVES